MEDLPAFLDLRLLLNQTQANEKTLFSALLKTQTALRSTRLLLKRAYQTAAEVHPAFHTYYLSFHIDQATALQLTFLKMIRLMHLTLIMAL